MSSNNIDSNHLINNNALINFDETELNKLKSQPLLSKATNLTINSGNIVSSNRIKKKSSLVSNDEIYDCIQSSLINWLLNSSSSEAREQNVINCRHFEYYEKLNNSERDDVSISVKLFIEELDPTIIEKAIESILNELGVFSIDTIILSFPDRLYETANLTKEIILPIWSIVETKIDNKVLLSAGVSDFNKKFLEQFCDLIENKTYLPSLNQVNLNSCCTMPDDLLEYAKINNIQLTTHSDSREILNSDYLQKCLKQCVHEYDAYGWKPIWYARYTLILKGRGIVQSKGYILNAQRELRYTK